MKVAGDATCVDSLMVRTATVAIGKFPDGFSAYRSARPRRLHAELCFAFGQESLTSIGGTSASEGAVSASGHVSTATPRTKDRYP